MRCLAALVAVLLVTAPAEARKRRARAPRDPATAGLGRHCKANTGCRHKSQVCLHENDANGKLLKTGFCALPCAAFDQGLAAKGEPQPDAGLGKPAPARCPKRYECRSAGAGVPFDLCVRQ